MTKELPEITPAIAARFRAFVTVAPNGCWLWTGSLTQKGYGRFRILNRVIRAHRFSWALAGHELPFGMVLDHRCHTRHCVRPAHLELVTQQVNAIRRIGRGEPTPEWLTWEERHELDRWTPEDAMRELEKLGVAL